VTHLRKMMLEELQRRHYSEATYKLTPGSVTNHLCALRRKSTSVIRDIWLSPDSEPQTIPLLLDYNSSDLWLSVQGSSSVLTKYSHSLVQAAWARCIAHMTLGLIAP